MKKVLIIIFLLVQILLAHAQTEFHKVLKGYKMNNNADNGIVEVFEEESKNNIEQHNLSFSTQTITECFKNNLLNKFGSSPIDTLKSSYQREYIWTNISFNTTKNSNSINTFTMEIGNYKHPQGNYDKFTFYITDVNGKDLLVSNSETQKEYSKIIQKWIYECL